VRPEHVRVAREDDASAADAPGALRATADIVETLGPETIVHAVVDGRRLSVLARVPGAVGVAHGDRIVLVPDMSKAVAFEDK
ncbi:MAG: TOBE domain-containing protein, partial [Kiritimatiellae bacterium]|nr:TOBE domain-containing protein [Kiritimatiellia bacterium]